MSILKGTDNDRTVMGWKEPFITIYEIRGSRLDVRQIMSMRLKQIAWQVAGDLVKRGQYLHGVMDVRVMESAFAGLDLYFQLLIQPFKDVLGAEDINYWEAKFQERLVFDLMAYASRQISSYVLGRLPGVVDMNKPMAQPPPTPTWKERERLEAIWQLVKQGLVTPAEFEKQRGLDASKLRPTVEHKWEILNKGKI